MPDRRFHRRFLWLALLGWLAQAFVPMAHAAAMADRTARHHGWCNTGVASTAGSAVLSQKIAALPGDIRRIIAQDFQTTDDTRPICAQLCAAPSSGGLPPAVPVLALAVVIDTTPRLDAVIAGHGAPAVPPPARGPPGNAS